MSKFGSRPAQIHAPITSTPGYASTHEGGLGLVLEPRSELFLLAAQNLVSENTFYETGPARDSRFEDLAERVTKEDPEWVRRFVPYLRNVMQMRSASIVLAATYVRAGGEHGRQVVSDACARADEPGEMLAYWTSRYGRKIPKPVKRGVADAVRRLYTERAVLRWDGNDRPWRFADVIELVHPTPIAAWQGQLFRYCLDRRHHSDARGLVETGGDTALGTIVVDGVLRTMPENERRANLPLAVKAGWSWERLSGWLPGGMDREAWEAIIPNMGYMALLRNLRNFDQAGVSDEVAARICEKFVTPAEVVASRQFPFRLYSAFREAGSLRWAYALERALDLSLDNVPTLRGRTLVLVDLSGSMQDPMSGHSTRRRSEIAMLFGLALAKRAEHANIVVYGAGSVDVSDNLRRPILSVVDYFQATNLGGTYTWTAWGQHYKDHDRTVLLTDGQAHDAPPPSFRKPVYTFDLGGYRHPAGRKAGTDGQYVFGGLTDRAFDLIPMIETARDGTWPF